MRFRYICPLQGHAIFILLKNLAIVSIHLIDLLILALVLLSKARFNIQIIESNKSLVVIMKVSGAALFKARIRHAKTRTIEASFHPIAYFLAMEA